MTDIGWSPASPLHLSVSAVVASHLEDLIASGRLAPGDRLPTEREMAAQLGVSRASVREALRDLELRGLADRRPGRGTVLTDPGDRPRQLLADLTTAARRREEVVDLREACEPAIARNAAFRATPRDIDRMAATLAGTDLDSSAEEANGIDERFHRELAQSAQNPLLVSLIDLVQSWLHDYRVQTQVTREGREHSLAGHMEILQAVRDRDPTKAAEAMIRHIRETAPYANRPAPHSVTTTNAEGELQ